LQIERLPKCLNRDFDISQKCHRDGDNIQIRNGCGVAMVPASSNGSTLSFI
jgi:hypothetical protein